MLHETLLGKSKNSLFTGLNRVLYLQKPYFVGVGNFSFLFYFITFRVAKLAKIHV